MAKREATRRKLQKKRKSARKKTTQNHTSSRTEAGALEALFGKENSFRPSGNGKREKSER